MMPTDVWKKFAELNEHFQKANALAVELSKSVGWSDLADDFADGVIDEYRLQGLYDELEEVFGPCPTKIADYGDFSNGHV